MKRWMVLIALLSAGPLSADELFIFDVAGPAETSECRYTWTKKFVVHPPASAAGSIVQELNLWGDVKKCDNTEVFKRSSSDPLAMYEMWPVGAGETSPPDERGDGAHDSFNAQFGPGTKGFIKLEGEIKFVPGKTWPADFPTAPPPPTPPAADNGNWAAPNPQVSGFIGERPGGTTKPDWFNVFESNQRTTKRTEIRYEWNCCVEGRGNVTRDRDRIKDQKPPKTQQDREKKKIEQDRGDGGGGRRDFRFFIGGMILLVLVAFAGFFLLRRRG